MNWPIFLLGIVIGWIIEWLVDLLFWRKRQKKWMADESGYLTQLSEVQAELENQRTLAAQFGEVPTGLEVTRANTETLQLRLATAEAERDRLDAKLATMTAERQEFADQFNRLSNLAATAPAAAGAGLLTLSRGETVDLQELSQEAGDDLTMIEGIGLKISAKLKEHGIRTFIQLAHTDVEHL
jgi:predicted flap endonuclease-1-like 5' DNA nuclease